MFFFTLKCDANPATLLDVLVSAYSILKDHEVRNLLALKNHAMAHHGFLHSHRPKKPNHIHNTTIVNK
jgi:hypothetical protein